MNAEYLKAKIGHLKAQRDRAIADANRFITLNDALIEDCEKLQQKLEQAEAIRKRNIDADAKEREELHAKINQLQAELAYERRQLSDSAALWSECECEINRLRTELADERDRFDRLSDFEVAEAKQYAAVKAEAERAKLAFSTVMNLLEKEGYPVGTLFVDVAMLVAAEERRRKCDRG